MRTRQPTTTTLENLRIPVQAKLAAAWTSFMFLYVYVDIIAFFKPGTIDEILVGNIWEFDVSQTLLTAFLDAHGDPELPCRLSMTLPASRPHHEPHLASVLGPLRGIQVVGESWTYFFGLGSTGSDPPRPHPAVRLDLAPHRTVGDHGDQPRTDRPVRRRNE